MTTEVRFGLALNGGVSLAIWIGGVADELLRAVSAGDGHPEAEPEYVALCQELDLAPKIDVIVGTSAGGVNGAFLATGLANGCANLGPLKRLWIDRGDFSELLRDPAEKPLPSLLKGDSFFLPHLQEAIEAVAAAGPGASPTEPPLDVRLTATALDGNLLSIPDGPNALFTVDHTVVFRFTDVDFDLAADPRSAARLARACRSTASFPGAFEPSPVEAGLYRDHHVPALVGRLDDGPVYLVDGGVLNNLPASQAVDAIVNQPSKDRVERVLGLVVPDPGLPPGRATVEPLFPETVTASAVGIPRNQCLSGFVADIQAHNQEVLGRRSARTALLRELAALPPDQAWARFSGLSDALFPSYRAARHRTSLDRMGTRLANQISVAAATAVAKAAQDADASPLPWVPRDQDSTAEDWSWGGSPIRRLASLLVTWTNLAATAAAHDGDEPAAQVLLASKAVLSRIRSDADRAAPTAAIDRLFLDELTGAPSPEDALQSALTRWSGAEEPRVGVELHGLLDELATQLHVLVEAVRPHLAAIDDPDAAAVLGGLVALHDGAPEADRRRLVVGFEVIELAFGAADPPPDQTIRLAQFSADRPVTIDPAQRDAPEEKLAGVQMGHFAAFLKRSWRANDWMWGRLDAAERLVRLLDQATGDRLATSGRLDHHLRAVQCAVLRDLLPDVVAEIANDAKGGANVGTQAKAFVDAVRAVGTPGPTPADPVSLAGVPEDELTRLLALNLVGVERLAAEAGSKRASSLSLNAMTTGAALLRQQGPGPVRAPARIMSGGTMAVWRYRALPAVRRRLLVGAVVVIVLVALLALVLGSLGGWAVLAWSVLGLAFLFALARGSLAFLHHRARGRAATTPVPPARSPQTEPTAAERKSA